MPNAMTTVGQGSTSFIAVPTWNATGATEATGGYYLRLKFSVASLAAVNHLIGASSSTAGSLRVTTTGALLYRNATADLITSAAGVIAINTIYEVILRRLYTPTAAIELLLNGVSVNTTTTITLGWLAAVNQLGRFSTSARSDITVYEFELYNGASSYSAVWDETGASGSGVNWADDTATRNLTMTNATGAANSWWLFYSAGVYVRAMLLKAAALSQITDAEVGTGKKPLVLLNGEVKERTASEGIPIVYDAGNLRTIAAGETLLI